MKLIKLLICISLFISVTLATSCGRKGSREAYPDYPKSYPLNNKCFK